MKLDESRLIGAAFGLYPSWWRERYLDEVKSVTEDMVATGRAPSMLAANLAIGALRARVRAVGMPVSYDAWVRRSCAVVVLATAPALAVLVVLETLHPGATAIPIQKTPAIPRTTAATSLYLLLFFGSLLLAICTIWGYFALCRGILESESDRRFRLLARAPKYFALLAFVLYELGAFIGPNSWTSHGGRTRALNGHIAASQVLRGVSTVALLLCVLSAALLLFEVARHAKLSLYSLTVGLRVSYVTTALLWLMSSVAIVLSISYGIGAAHVGSGLLTAFPSGGALALMAALLAVLAIVATLGTVLAGHSIRVARSLAS